MTRWRGALARVVDVRDDEIRAMLMSAVFFFFIMSGYFVLRPIRDEMAVASGVRNLPWLFAGTLTATLLCNPLFSAVVARQPVRRVMTTTYHFFAASLLAFFAARSLASPGDDIWLGRAFFIWTSVIAMFAPSVFWSFMADAFRSAQAKRLFGFIGVGGTLGAVTGSALTASLARTLGTTNLLLVSLGLFELAVLVVSFFPRARPVPAPMHETGSDAPGVRDETQPIGGHSWAGITALARSPYLIAIAGFLMLYIMGSTILYFQQTDIFGRYFSDRAQRTQVLAQMEMATQILALVTQTFLTGRVIRWIGLGTTLALLPALSVIGFGALGSAPAVATIVVFAVLRRGTNFALTNPAMEALFTVVSREDKYKAKSFIETFVYRGADQVASLGYAGLAALGLGLAGIAYAAIPLCIAWLALGLWLGRRHAVLAGRQPAAVRVQGVAIAGGAD